MNKNQDIDQRYKWHTVNLSAPLHVFEELLNQVIPESYRTLPDGTNTYLAILDKLQTFHGIVLKELEDAIVEYVKEHPGCTAGSIYEIKNQSEVFKSEIMYNAAMKSARRTRLDVVRASGNRKLHYLKGKAPSS